MESQGVDVGFLREREKCCGVFTLSTFLQGYNLQLDLKTKPSDSFWDFWLGLNVNIKQSLKFK